MGPFFLVFLTKSLSKCPSFTNALALKNFWFRTCTSALLFSQKKFHFKCLTMFSIRLCLDNCSLICTVTFCYVLHRTHSEFYHIQHSAFSGLCWHIQSYSALLRHIHAYWDSINAYSGLLRDIQPLMKPSHIHNLAIFWALAYLKLEAYLKSCETLTKHIHNPVITLL